MTLQIYRHLLSMLLAWVVVGIVLATITGHVLNWPALSAWGGKTEMALNTATCLLLLSISFLLRVRKRCTICEIP
jgi:hypothetical protein